MGEGIQCASQKCICIWTELDSHRAFLKKQQSCWKWWMDSQGDDPEGIIGKIFIYYIVFSFYRCGNRYSEEQQLCFASKELCLRLVCLILFSLFNRKRLISCVEKQLLEEHMTAILQKGMSVWKVLQTATNWRSAGFLLNWYTWVFFSFFFSFSNFFSWAVLPVELYPVFMYVIKHFQYVKSTHV